MPVKKNDLDRLIADLSMQVQMLKQRLDVMEREGISPNR